MSAPHVQEFSSVRLECGDVRTIAVLAGSGSPCVASTIFRGREIISRTLFFQRELPLLEQSIAWARAPDGVRFDAGEFAAGRLNVRVFATAWPGNRPAVAFGRVHPDGTRVGRATMLRGDEIEALALAIDHYREITAACAAETGNKHVQEQIQD